MASSFNPGMIGATEIPVGMPASESTHRLKAGTDAGSLRFYPVARFHHRQGAILK